MQGGLKTKISTPIRSRLAWLVVACLLPALVAVVMALYYGYLQARSEFIRESLSTALSFRYRVDEEFACTEASLQALATSPHLKKKDYAAFHQQVQTLARGNRSSNILLIEASGEIVMDSAEPFEHRQPKAINQAQLARVFKLGYPDVSEIFTTPQSGKPLVNVAVPVYGTAFDRDITHALVKQIPLEKFQKFLLDNPLPGEQIAVIFDGSGTIAAATGSVGKFIGLRVGADLFGALQKADHGSLELVSVSGIPMLSVFSRSPTSRWGVAIGIPRATFTNDLWRSFWLLAGGAALLLVSSLALAWSLGGRIAHTICALLEPAVEMGHGRAVVVPELPIREVDEVGQAITKASAMLVDARQTLASTEVRLSGILEAAQDAIITVDEQLVIVMFNPAAVTMFACPALEAMGSALGRFIPEPFHTPDDAIHPEGEDNPGSLSQHGAKDDSYVGGDRITTGVRTNAYKFPIEISYSSVFESGAAFHTLIVRDITRRVLAQEALERSNIDLQHFAFVASHDLKTPLRSISGFVQLLERNYADKLDDKGLSLIQRTGAAAQRLEQLTEDLLAYARVSSDVRPFLPVDCQHVANELISLLDAAIADSGGLVEVVGVLPVVMGDRIQLLQLFLNLVGNGLKYCRGRTPVVRLSAQRHDHDWVFSVADNGIGIDARHHDKVFEVFKRLHTQQEFPGTGIGLAVCRRIVEGHGGKIWFTSTLGEGATFYFSLPHTPHTLPTPHLPQVPSETPPT